IEEAEATPSEASTPPTTATPTTVNSQDSQATSDAASNGSSDTPNTSTAETMCSDSCGYSGDGVCDDGGENAYYDVCSYGTDCSDCGARLSQGETSSDSSSSNNSSTSSATATACSGSGASGTFMDEPFNGLQLTYSIDGVCLGDYEDGGYYTQTRGYTVTGISGQSVTVSGTSASNEAVCNSDYGSFWFDTEVSVTVGDEVETYSSPKPCTQETTDRYEVSQPAYSFNLSVPVSNYGSTVTFEIKQIYVNPRYGNRGLTVSGSYTSN
ncbi:MAG: hypothetical protein HQL48_11840, partial [Gammaproteobacteria bacterium]|nr:hypothetical protein [Gammaproteobacteria bacterium]